MFKFKLILKANLKTKVKKKHLNLGMKRFSSESLKKYSHDLLPSGERWLSITIRILI